VEGHAANAPEIPMVHSEESRTVQLLALSVVVSTSGNKLPATIEQVQTASSSMWMLVGRAESRSGASEYWARPPPVQVIGTAQG
jgi:hypothetical protein